jgi:ProQ/FINO family
MEALMTDLSKTSGSSPPKNFCDRAPTIYVTREKNVEYRNAVNAYRAARKFERSALTDLETYRIYSEGLEAVRQQVLGEQYQPGGGWNVQVERPPEQIARAASRTIIELEPNEFERYRLAMDAFVLANQDAVRTNYDLRDYRNRKTELRREFLGGRYVAGSKIRCTAKGYTQPRKEIFANLSPRFNPAPATIEQREFRADVAACREWLLKTFPNAFFPNGARKKPLNTYIVSDIVNRFNMTSRERDVVRHAINQYRNAPGYRETLVLGAERVSASGKVVDYVVETDPDYIHFTRSPAPAEATQPRHAARTG